MATCLYVQLLRVNLLVSAIKRGIGDLARAKGLKDFRVLDKMNARGETVIALILPANDSLPSLTRPSLTREEKREKSQR